MAYKRMIADLTYITELTAVKDSVTGKWIPIRKFPADGDGHEKISNPPTIDENAPIDPIDDRIIGCGLARTTPLEQYQVEANDITTSLLRCNTSMQPLISPSQAKSASYYAANYVSKDPYELSSSLPFLYQAQLELQKYGSKAEDHGQKSRNLKVLMEKLLHKVNKIEVSSQQAACAMLGYDSFYSSHDFSYCFAWDALKRYHESQRQYEYSDVDSESSSDDTSEDFELLDEEYEVDQLAANSLRKKFIPKFKSSGKLVVNKNGNVIAISQFIKYINRGPAFAAYSLYDYAAIVRHHNSVKKERVVRNSIKGELVERSLRCINVWVAKHQIAPTNLFDKL